VITRNASCAFSGIKLLLSKLYNRSGVLPPGVDNPDIFVGVRSGDFLTDEKIGWRDAYEAQLRAAMRPLAQAAE